MRDSLAIDIAVVAEGDHFTVLIAEEGVNTCCLKVEHLLVRSVHAAATWGESDHARGPDLEASRATHHTVEPHPGFDVLWS